MQFDILDHMPAGLLGLKAHELADRLAGPTMIHLPGRRPDPLFVSVIQHGNETSGWDAVRRLLAGRYARDPLPRSMALLIGNVEAAAEHRRRLDHQPDMNRCWPGSHDEVTPLHRELARITEHVRQLRPFASIDIHNNTGENPHYAAVNAIEPQRLMLASRFSRTVIFFTEPSGVQSMAFGAFCPAVTLECGQPGQQGGTDHAMAYLETVLNIDELPQRFPNPEDLDLFQVTTAVRVDSDCSFSFGEPGADLVLDPEIDRMNFTELPPGTSLARHNGADRSLLVAIDTDGHDCTSDWFEIDGDRVVTRRPAMPAMLSTHAEVVRQDCLCYLMERMRIRRPAPNAGRHTELPESAP